MLAYAYDYSGKYTGTVDVDLCQITEQRRALEQQQIDEGIEGVAVEPQVYIVPANATMTEPPSIDDGEEAIWDGTKWTVQEIPPPPVVEEPIPPTPTYRELRAAAYPDMRDYLDGIVKNDAAQIQTYIDECLAVKARYPKPTT